MSELVKISESIFDKLHLIVQIAIKFIVIVYLKSEYVCVILGIKCSLYIHISSLWNPWNVLYITACVGLSWPKWTCPSQQNTISRRQLWVTQSLQRYGNYVLGFACENSLGSLSVKTLIKKHVARSETDWQPSWALRGHDWGDTEHGLGQTAVCVNWHNGRWSQRE